jgi:deazaflavin-dependent oxidoreductase (nitroreductase family)
VPEGQPYTERQQRIAAVVMKFGKKLNNVLYRSTGGKVGGRFIIGGAPVCLLTTTGRKSGESRTVALLYLRDGDDVVVVGSQGGMPRHPGWYHNLTADPNVTVQIGRDVGRYVARTATGDEREALWRRLVVMYPGYDDYQKKTDREIPVVVCTPA